MTGVDAEAHANRWCAEDQDRATAWAFGRGFAWASDEPLEATEEGQDSPYATWALVPAEGVVEAL